MISLRRFLLSVCVLFAPPLPAYAILLDCDINSDGTYHCIDITGNTGGTPVESENNYSEAYSRYLEQARSRCVYEEPRKRGGKKTGAALRSEELKSAREAYERCVTDNARALWLQDNPANN
jgi:hypothetical protein